jgi:hypothetical protein
MMAEGPVPVGVGSCAAAGQAAATAEKPAAQAIAMRYARDMIGILARPCVGA